MNTMASATLMMAPWVMSFATDGPTLAELMIDPPSRMSGFLKLSTLFWLTKPPLLQCVVEHCLCVVVLCGSFDSIL